MHAYSQHTHGWLAAGKRLTPENAAAAMAAFDVKANAVRGTFLRVNSKVGEGKPEHQLLLEAARELQGRKSICLVTAPAAHVGVWDRTSGIGAHTHPAGPGLSDTSRQRQLLWTICPSGHGQQQIVKHACMSCCQPGPTSTCCCLCVDLWVCCVHTCELL